MDELATNSTRVNSNTVVLQRDEFVRTLAEQRRKWGQDRDLAAGWDLIINGYFELTVYGTKTPQQSHPYFMKLF